MKLNWKTKKNCTLFFLVFIVSLSLQANPSSDISDFFEPVPVNDEVVEYQATNETTFSGSSFNYGRYENALFSPNYYDEWGLCSSANSIWDFSACSIYYNASVTNNYFSPSVKTDKDTETTIIQKLLLQEIPYSYSTSWDAYLMIPLLDSESFKISSGLGTGGRMGIWYFTNLVNIGSEISYSMDMTAAVEGAYSFSDSISIGSFFSYSLLGMRIDIHDFSRNASFPTAFTHPFNNIDFTFDLHLDIKNKNGTVYRIIYRSNYNRFEKTGGLTAESSDSLGFEIMNITYEPKENEDE